MFLPYFLEYNRYMNIIGIGLMFLIALFFSHNRAAIKWSLILKAFVLQCLVGMFMLKSAWGRAGVEAVALGVQKLSACAQVGMRFMFGNLIDPSGAWGMIFAVRVLPVLIFFGAFIAILFHFKLIQRLVALINAVVHPLLGTSGAETLSAIATGLLGQTEALFFVRNYVGVMTKAELFVVMTSGMSAISASLISVFSTMGVSTVHLLTSVSMSIFGSIMMAKILFPDDPRSSAEQQRKEHAIDVTTPPTTNVLEAIASGTSDGLQVAFAIGAMLISFLSLLALVNYLLIGIGSGINSVAAAAGVAWRLPELTLDVIFSYLFCPFGYLLGFAGEDALVAGQLLGKKVAINEFIAYSSLVSTQLPERVATIMTYALCGFSNFACIGIQMGGIGVFAPERRAWIAELGLYAVLGGALSNLITAMIAALLI